MTPFVNSNLIVEHCLHANNVVYKTICDILRKEDVDDNDEVMYHAEAHSNRPKIGQKISQNSLKMFSQMSQ
jgi:hypothetical protein